MKIGNRVKYVEFHEYAKFNLTNTEEIVAIDPIETKVKIELLKKFENIQFITNESFLYNNEDLESFHQNVKNKQRITHKSFYNWSLDKQPKLHKIIDKNLDALNRKVYAGDPIYKSKINRSRFVIEAIEYVETHFRNNYGSTATFSYPINHAQAKNILKKFLDERLIHYGDYQDSINFDDPVLYHSMLSSSLNIGLITPIDVIKAALKTWNANREKIKKNNFEGFIRQIIGWREYMHYIYIFHEDELLKSNALGLNNKLNKAWWTGKTPLEPVNLVIKQTLKFAYMNHIQRLMIVLNAMILSETRPDDIVKWFTELSIDAYDWVMISNVYAMGGFSSKFMSRPYISSSKYLVRMGLAKGKWEQVWDDMYRKFVCKKKNTVPNLKFYSAKC
jgi:deoxyribodipyrimidine photolyase-related protein